jgi:hypothetical protein
MGQKIRSSWRIQSRETGKNRVCVGELRGKIRTEYSETTHSAAHRMCQATYEICVSGTRILEEETRTAKESSRKQISQFMSPILNSGQDSVRGSTVNLDTPG